jgi:hypothetical protein
MFKSKSLKLSALVALLVLGNLASTSARADDPPEFRTITCFQVAEEVAERGVKYAVVVKPIARSLSYTLQVARKRFPGGQYQDVLRTTVVAKAEDVMLFFRGKQPRVALNIYMDELDQTALSINGRDVARMECRFQY